MCSQGTDAPLCEWGILGGHGKGLEHVGEQWGAVLAARADFVYPVRSQDLTGL